MDLHVSRQPVFDLLSKNTFAIPKYQREYAWDEEHCNILWEDLIQFYKENKGKERDYFLGTIVCYEEEITGKELHVIDGQQRITTLILLLKALYRKLERMKKDSPNEENKIKGQQSSIGPCVWHIDPITKAPSFNSPRITTQVYTNPEYNNHLKKVLSDCDLETDQGFDDKYKYVRNYKFFIKKIDDLSPEELGLDGNLFELILCLENSCVLLPITCKDFEMGLTIFETINDRGMPLSDADIFKQKLYEDYYKNKKAREFNEKWTEINTICNDGNKRIDIVDLFKYYMHIIRADKEKTDNIKALRPFYIKDHKSYLSEKKDTLIRDLRHQAILWYAIHNEFPDNDYGELFKDIDDDTRKYLQILMQYPNEWSQNIVTVLWNKYDDKNEKFNPYLRKIIAALYFLFIKHRNVVHIRPKAYVINNNIYHDRDPLDKVFKPEEITREEIEKLVTNFIEERRDGRAVKGLLILYTYLDTRQEHISKIGDYQIEHILPKKWQNTNYKGWEKEDADKYLESMGNKVRIERKVNIQADNEYFNKKKARYKDSNIHELRSISNNHEQQDWVQTDIERREKKMIETFTNFFFEEFPNPSTA